MKRPYGLLVVMALFSLLLVQRVLPLAAQGEDWLPAPTGPYQVGTALFHWVDVTRDETYTDDPNDKRELVVQLWYPADVEEGAIPAMYLPYAEIEAPYFASAWMNERREFTELSKVLSQTPTHSYLDQPISASQSNYPVLVFSPGLPGMPHASTVQIEELASHGYVVAAINHPYISGWTVFPDGRVATTKPTEFFLSGDNLDQSVIVGVQDQMFVLDQLALLNEASMDERFSNHLDLDHVGTFGVSWGAWVTPLAGLLDDRFTAAMVQVSHSRVVPQVVEEGLDIPVMFVDTQNDNSRLGYFSAEGPVYLVKIRQISNLGPGDFLLWPGAEDQWQSYERGDLEPARMLQLVNAYILAFFNRYLKGEDAPLLEGPSPDYPEVEIQARNVSVEAATPPQDIARQRETRS